jgi:Protein of unknown function (DUF664)
VPPSNLSLVGLVRHLTGVEQEWFRIKICWAGRTASFPFRRRPELGFRWRAVPDPAVVAEAWRTWRAEVAFADQFVAEAPDLDVVGKHGDVRREVLVHLTEEYARHDGHADFLRQRIDRRVGPSSDGGSSYPPLHTRRRLSSGGVLPCL